MSGSALSRSEVGHAVYVDNFPIVGHDPHTVCQAASQHSAAMSQKSLKIHEEERVGTNITFAGIEFNGQSRQCQVSHKRLWRLRRALDFILECDQLRGDSLEVIVGHITWAALCRREVLSVTSAVYVFIHTHRSDK